MKNCLCSKYRHAPIPAVFEAISLLGNLIQSAARKRAQMTVNKRLLPTALEFRGLLQRIEKRRSKMSLERPCLPPSCKPNFDAEAVHADQTFAGRRHAHCYPSPCARK